MEFTTIVRANLFRSGKQIVFELFWRLEEVFSVAAKKNSVFFNITDQKHK